ncbi:MAG: hypothetical protein OCU24_01990 [Candidatus Methanospirare jalkutatii]|nr:hypothetical protein [Candidatus Methanospirare jalkutatii]
MLAFIVGSFSSIGAVNAYKVGVEWTNTYGFDYNDTDEGLIPLGDLSSCDVHTV